MLTPATELRLIAREAQRVWLEIRRRKGYDRFTDKPALATLRTAAQRATRWGEWGDIEAAIRAHALDAEANPHYLDEWTREQYATRVEAERITEKAAAKRDQMFGRPRSLAEIVAGVGKPCPGWKPLIIEGDQLRCANCGVVHRSHP